MSNKLICILGESGGGKSYLEEQIAKKMNFQRLISTTTRSKRPYEKDGVHYYFCSDEQFEKVKLENGFIETATYAAGSSIGGTVKYGLEKRELEDKLKLNHCLFVVNPEGYREILNKLEPENVIGIYVKTNDTTRMLKTISRYGDDSEKYLSEICRRYLADKEYFNDEIIKTCITVENDYSDAFIFEAINAITTSK